MFGATLGKFATRIRVVRTSGEPLTWKAAIVRNLWRLIDALPCYLIGTVVAARSDLTQRLGDQYASTIVVRHRGNPQANRDD
jgi:uncharacterized RDD family membrane protein YckC